MHKKLLLLLEPWPLFVCGIAVAALCVRLVVIRTWSGGGYDLQIYRYFSDLAARGIDPYAAPPNGPVPGIYGDNQPFEFLLLGGLLRVHSSADTLRYFFAVLESATVAVIGFGFSSRSKRWRLAVMTLVAFSPFVLLSWSAATEDKSITLLLLVLVLVCVERGWITAAWAVATVLMVIKFESLFFLIPFAAYTFKHRGARFTATAIGLFAAGVVIAEAPYFPTSLRAYSRRSARIDYTPGHSSPTIILDRLGLYDHRMVRPLIVVSLVLVAFAFVRGWIDVSSAIVLSMFASFFFLPDESYDRIALIVLPLIFIIRLTRMRLIWIWLVTIVSAVALYTVSFTVPSIANASALVRTASRPIRVSTGRHLHEPLDSPPSGLLRRRRPPANAKLRARPRTHSARLTALSRAPQLQREPSGVSSDFHFQAVPYRPEAIAPPRRPLDTSASRSPPARLPPPRRSRRPCGRARAEG